MSEGLIGISRLREKIIRLFEVTCINQSMKTAVRYGALISLLILLLYLPLLTTSYERIYKLTSEDHIYENSQAFFFLLSSCVMFYLFFNSKSERGYHFSYSNRNYFFLCLGLVLFFFFGEEISWGQRIFGIHSTESLKQMNAQGETNIHNLWIFFSFDKDLKSKTGLINLINSARLFALFWFLYCLLIPAIDSFSPGVNRFFRRISLPILPLWIGLLFLFAHAVSKLAGSLWPYRDVQPISEIKESSFAMLYIVVSISFFITFRKPLKLKLTNKDIKHKTI
jgi:hypothetical protein